MVANHLSKLTKLEPVKKPAPKLTNEAPAHQISGIGIITYPLLTPQNQPRLRTTRRPR